MRLYSYVSVYGCVKCSVVLCRPTRRVSLFVCVTLFPSDSNLSSVWARVGKQTKKSSAQREAHTHSLAHAAFSLSLSLSARLMPLGIERASAGGKHTFACWTRRRAGLRWCLLVKQSIYQGARRHPTIARI